MIPSPCETICKLNQHDICIGCGRTKLEITHWSSMNDLAQYMVSEKAKVRLKTIVERTKDYDQLS
jgi:uncharacterized protein